MPDMSRRTFTQIVGAAAVTAALPDATDTAMAQPAPAPAPPPVPPQGPFYLRTLGLRARLPPQGPSGPALGRSQPRGDAPGKQQGSPGVQRVAPNAPGRPPRP